MNTGSRFAPVLPILTAGWLACAASFAAIAADESSWDDDTASSARLIAAGERGEAGGRILRAGVEIKLKPGWKTYWRYPGDSGVPPAFDFGGSDNVKSVTVKFPAPMKFDDGAGGHSIGYKSDVILPLHVVPQNAAKPVTLRLKLDYAVCEKLCVPAKAEVALELTGSPGSHAGAVDAAEARVPKPAAVGATGALAIRAVSRESGAGKPRVAVDLATPPGTVPTVLAEGPTLHWALPVPEPVSGAPPGLQRFAFVLDGLPPGERPEGATLRLTAVAGEQAIEVAFRLD